MSGVMVRFDDPSGFTAKDFLAAGKAIAAAAPTALQMAEALARLANASAAPGMPAACSAEDAEVLKQIPPDVLCGAITKGYCRKVTADLVKQIVGRWHGF